MKMNVVHIIGLFLMSSSTTCSQKQYWCSDCNMVPYHTCTCIFLSHVSPSILFSIFYEFNSQLGAFCRSTLWIHRFGMLSSLQQQEAYMVHFDVWERFVYCVCVCIKHSFSCQKRKILFLDYRRTKYRRDDFHPKFSPSQRISP